MGDSGRTPDPILRRLYPREEELLRRLAAGEDTPELRAELERVRAAIRRRLRHEAEPDADAGDAPNGAIE